MSSGWRPGAALKRLLLSAAATLALAAVLPTIAFGATVSPPSLHFPLEVGTTSAPQSFTITNDGPEDVMLGVSLSGFTPFFNLVGGPCGATLAAGADCTVDVTATAYNLDYYNDSIQISIDGIPELGAGLSVDGYPGVTTASITPDPLVMPAAMVGDAPSIGFLTVTNTGAAAMYQLFPFVTSGEFSVLGGDCGAYTGPYFALNPGGTCQLVVGFFPTSLGVQSGSLQLFFNEGSSATVGLSGKGVNVLFDVTPMGADFGAVALGSTSAPRSFTVTNDSAASVTLATSTFASGFSITGGTCGASLAAGSSCTVDMEFQPLYLGSHNGWLEVNFDGGAAIVSPSIFGNGIAPFTTASVSPGTVVFPATVPGTPTFAMVTVTNTGTAPMVPINMHVPAPEFFAIGGSCQSYSGPYFSLPAGDSCTYQLIFLPNVLGVQTSTATVYFNNGLSRTFAVSGTASAPLSNAGSQAGGYVVAGGPNVEVNRDRFEWALRTRADGSLRGKTVTYRFTQAGTRYVARMTVGSIATESFFVSGGHATFEGAATLASVVGAVETPVPGSWTLHVESQDLVPGSNNGAGVETVFLQLSSGAGVFHATGSAASPAVIQVGAIGNSDTWIS